MRKTTKIIALFLVVATLASVLAISVSAVGQGYPMSCTIYYKDEGGNTLANAKAFQVNASDESAWSTGFSSPTIAGYALKYDSDSFVTYEMMDKYFPTSNYVRQGSATYTVYYVKTYTHSVYYMYGVNTRPAATAASKTGKPGTSYSFTSPKITGYSPTQSTVSGTIGSSNSSTTVYYYPYTYTVSYDANGGSGAPASQTKTYGVNLTLSSTIPTKSGYTFAGWATSPGSSNVAYSPGGTYTGNSNINLYAVWQQNAVTPTTYTIIYNANGGIGAPSSQTKTKDVDVQLSSIVPTRSGYTFLGWAMSKTSTYATYQPGDSYTFNSSTVFYAVWSQNAPAVTTYTVTYNANGGSGAPASQTKEYGVMLILSSKEPTRSGYTFLGWAKTSNATMVAYYAGSDYTANESVTLYAVWEANSTGSSTITTTCTVTYNANGGSGAPSSQSVMSGSKLTLSSVTPVRSGYTFKGWSTQSWATSPSYSAGCMYTITSNMTLYAVWQLGGTYFYTVTFDANGGTGAPDPITADYGETITIPDVEPYRSGYNFINWENVNTSEYYCPGDTMTVSGTTTLRAVWYEARWDDDPFGDEPTVLTTYTVSYNANGGSGAPSSQTKTQGVTLTLLSTKPTRSGYTFQGWSTSSTASYASYYAGGSYTDDASATLYAVWKQNTVTPTTYTISYNANGGSGAPSSQTKTHGVALTLSSVKPTRSGYTFLGWSTSSTATSAMYSAGGSYTANASATLYAVWQKITYNFTISNLTATPNEVYKGENTHVSFNLKLTCTEAKSGIPVEVYFDGTLVYSANLNFSANGTNLVAFDLNVGSSIGQKTLTARVNFTDRINETNSSDNSASVTVNVKKYIETSSSVVPISGTYIEGMEVISSFFAENGGSEDIMPSDNMNFGFEVYEMNGTSETLVLSQKKNNTVIPASGSNLVYFKWTIPSGSAGKTYMVKGTMNIDGKTDEVNAGNNSSFFTFIVNDKESSQTPDTRYESSAPTSYSKNTQKPATNIESVSWNEWEYDSATSSLVLKKYGVSVSNAPTIIPDAECKTATKSGDMWTMKSGYGITASWSPTLETPSGCIKAKEDSTTNAQLAYARFPEFAYSDASGFYRTLEKTDDGFAFIENPDAVNNTRVHFIPVYVANGDYTVPCTASQIWTPAGMITVTLSANTLKINGTIYDDWYQG